MNRISLVLFGMATIMLAACGAYAPPIPTRSTAELRQTDRALAGATPLPTIAGGAPAAPTPELTATAAAMAALIAVPADDPRTMGSPQAPVTIIEFSDFE